MANNDKTINNEQSLNKFLRRKISFWRGVIILFLASFFLLSILVSLLILYNVDIGVETFYMHAPKTPKASLYLSPREGRFKVGDDFIVNVLINTKGSNVVASAAYLSYNNTKMEAVSIDTSDSVFTMEAEKVINHEAGKIKITMGKPTPGINIHDGKIAVIHFKALESMSPSDENIYFDFNPDSSLFSTVIIDDKLGTNILSSIAGAKIFIRE